MIEINLLPWREHLKSKKRFQQGVEILLAFLLSISLLSCFHLIINSQLKAKKESILQRQRDLDQVNKRLKAVRLFHQELDHQQLPDLSLIFNYQRHLLHFLRKLTEWMPRDLRLQQIHFNEQTWLLEGVSPQLVSILHFAEHFKSSLQVGPRNNDRIGREKYLKIRKQQSLFQYQLRLEFKA